MYYTDKNLGRALNFLGQHIDIDKTIIVITADHGEEFNDTGKNYWGHNGNFTKGFLPLGSKRSLPTL